MATGIQSWSTTAATNATADSTINWAEGQAPSTVNNSARAMMAVIAKYYKDINGTLATTGSANVYAVTNNGGDAAYYTGMTLAVTPNFSNTAACTINVNTIGAKSIKLLSGSDPAANDILSGAIQILIYNGTNFILINKYTNFALYALLAGATFTGDVVLASIAASSTLSAGFRGAPQNAQTGDYTFVDTDAGKSIYHNSGSTHTFTIPANASVAYPIGTIIQIVNPNGSGVLTVAITSDTLNRGDGTAGTGSRTMAANSICSVEKTAATVWYITGPFT